MNTTEEKESRQTAGQTAAPTAEPGDPAGAPPRKKRRGGAPVVLYLALLFVAAFAMLLLAFFVQQRNDGEAVFRPAAVSAPARDGAEATVTDDFTIEKVITIC